MSSTGAVVSRTPQAPLRKLILEARDDAGFKALDVVEATGAAHIKTKLPIIRGAAVTVEASKEADLRKLAQTLGMIVYEDRVVSLPERDAPGRPANIPHPDNLYNATRTIGADKLWGRGFTGQGVGVAIIDTGIAPHKDLGNRIVAFKDCINNRSAAYDDHGHGTHVAGIAAGDGKMSGGYLAGTAPGANIIGVKVLDGYGAGSMSSVVAGIQWAVDNKERYNIRVLNMSLGAPIQMAAKNDPICQAVEAANAAGIVTCVAAGNAGPLGGTLQTPANAPHCIAVAAVDDRGTPWRSDDRIPPFSGRGPAPIDGIDKPDVAAPGVGIMSLKANTDGYTAMTGTSMASPMVAGAAALLLSVHPQASPEQVKSALMSTAYELPGYGRHSEGAGEIDVPAAELQLNELGR
jgi:serine protease AprX